MTPSADEQSLLDELAREQGADRQLHADLVETIGKAEDAIKEIERNTGLEAARRELKQWLSLNEADELDSPDRDYVARLQDSKTTTWDLRPLADDQILALARAGMLTVKTGPFESLMKAAPSTVWNDICAKPGVRYEGVEARLYVRKAER